MEKRWRREGSNNRKSVDYFRHQKKKKKKLRKVSVPLKGTATRYDGRSEQDKIDKDPIRQMK